MSTKIQTFDLALESVEKDGSTYRLGRARPLGVSGSLPPVEYDTETQTVWSVGGKKIDVDMPYSFFGADRPWAFGPRSSAEANEKARIQERRARALIRHAESE
jgi:hypothetical protein